MTIGTIGQQIANLQTLHDRVKEQKYSTMAVLLELSGLLSGAFPDATTLPLYAADAIRGSTNDALTLHYRLLRGWHLRMETQRDGSWLVWTDEKRGLRRRGFQGHNRNLAVALFLATAQAHIARMHLLLPEKEK